MEPLVEPLALLRWLTQNVADLSCEEGVIVGRVLAPSRPGAIVSFLSLDRGIEQSIALSQLNELRDSGWVRFKDPTDSVCDAIAVILTKSGRLAASRQELPSDLAELKVNRY